MIYDMYEYVYCDDRKAVGVDWFGIKVYERLEFVWQHVFVQGKLSVY